MQESLTNIRSSLQGKVQIAMKEYKEEEENCFVCITCAWAYVSVSSIHAVISKCVGLL